MDMSVISALSIWKAEAGGSLGLQGQSGLHSKFQVVDTGKKVYWVENLLHKRGTESGSPTSV